jgi:hypothetical protein
MVLLPDLTGLIVFSVKRKVIKKRWHALLQSINAKRFRTFGEMALDFVKSDLLFSVGIRCRRYL